MNIIKKGQYTNRMVNILMQTPCVMQTPIVKINSDTVAEYKLVDDGKKNTAGRAVGGAILAGPLGALIGAASGKKKHLLVDIKWKDGKKSLLECDEKAYKAIVKSCYE